MPRPEMGKTYLIVFCKSCAKGFRVVDDALNESRQVELAYERMSLKCRGCGHEAVYRPDEMRVAKMSTKQEAEQARQRKADAQRN